MINSLEKIYKDLALIYKNKYKYNDINVIKRYIFFIGKNLLNYKFNKENKGKYEILNKIFI